MNAWKALLLGLLLLLSGAAQAQEVPLPSEKSDTAEPPAPLRLTSPLRMTRKSPSRNRNKPYAGVI